MTAVKEALSSSAAQLLLRTDTFPYQLLWPVCLLRRTVPLFSYVLPFFKPILCKMTVGSQHLFLSSTRKEGIPVMDRCPSLPPSPIPPPIEDLLSLPVSLVSNTSIFSPSTFGIHTKFLFYLVSQCSLFRSRVMQQEHGGRLSREKGGKGRSSTVPWASQNVAQTLPRASEGSDVLLHNRAYENSPETHINESLDGLSTVWRPLSPHLLRLQVKNLLMVHIMAINKRAREKERREGSSAAV